MAIIALKDIPFIGKLFADKKSSRVIESYISNLDNDIRYKEYALQLCIDLISNAMSKVEYITYQNRELIKKNMWWSLNYQPNINSNQSDFIADVINQMIRNEDGALVLITKDKQLVVAKDYEVKEFAFKENIYKNIVVAGDFQVAGVKKESEVLNFRLNNGKITKFLNLLYEEYSKLIEATMKNYYRGNAKKIILKMDAMFDQFENDVVETNEDGEVIRTKQDDIIDDLYKNRFKALLSEEDSITPLEEGLSVEYLQDNQGYTKSGALTTRDIADIFDDVLNMAADAFHIPRGLLKGDVADVEAMRENFVRFAVEPFVDIIETEINRKMYKQSEVSNGTKLKIDTSTLSIGSFETFANAAEAYFRIGAYTTNEIRLKLGEETIDESWADTYHITKNYQHADDVGSVETFKGGEKISDD